MDIEKINSLISDQGAVVRFSGDSLRLDGEFKYYYLLIIVKEFSEQSGCIECPVKPLSY